MIREILQRLPRLHRLLWMEDRVAELEAQMRQLQGISKDLDTLKSSFDVPQEMIEEFFEWRSNNPIPEEPLVSIAVATYNRSRLLAERCIPSVLGQTYKNLEMIVVGDGCTDDTAERIAEFQDPRLKFVNLPRRDVYPTDPTRRWLVAGTRPTDEALSMTTGDFVTQLDDDDEYLPERLEKLVDFAKSNDCDVVWHPFWQESEGGEWSLVKGADFVRGEITNGAVLYRSWFKKVRPSIAAHRLYEPGDWNRFRRFRYINPVGMRYPEPLLKKYGERRQGR